ncbi:MAG: hypothetical protein EPN41_03360 [Candidimonas sp.]|nr:MAG: hypothetical protein EPN41_03360 [Candidimonas sp.]
MLLRYLPRGGESRRRARRGVADGLSGYLVLGGVYLCLTRVEALYADMGHFGRTPIRMAWFWFALPALLLNYFGQAAVGSWRPRGTGYIAPGLFARWGVFLTIRPEASTF